MRSAKAMMLLLACLALSSGAQAQPQVAPNPAGGEPPGLAPIAPTPAVRHAISLKFTDPRQRMPVEEVTSVLAYLATDPQVRKSPDFALPPVTQFLELGPGIFTKVAPDFDAFVTLGVESRMGIDAQITAMEANQKDAITATAKRIADGLESKVPNDQREKRLHDIDERLANLKDKMELLNTVAANTAKLGPEILKDRIKSAELERQRLEMDLEAQRVRSDAIAKQIDRIRMQSDAKLETDAILKQLREVVKLRDVERERVKQLTDAGTAPMAELREADDKVMQANIRVTEREEAIRQTTSASLLERLNDELATNMINRAEMEMRLQLIRRQQPSIDVKDLDEEKLNRLTDEYRALFRNPGTLPPLYFQLEKQGLELRAEKLALIVSEVKLTDASATTQPAPAR